MGSIIVRRTFPIVLFLIPKPSLSFKSHSQTFIFQLRILTSFSNPHFPTLVLELPFSNPYFLTPELEPPFSCFIRTSPVFRTNNIHFSILMVAVLRRSSIPVKSDQKRHSLKRGNQAEGSSSTIAIHMFHTSKGWFEKFKKRI